jgi:hypothetical protein
MENSGHIVEQWELPSGRNISGLLNALLTFRTELYSSFINISSISTIPCLSDLNGENIRKQHSIPLLKWLSTLLEPIAVFMVLKWMPFLLLVTTSFAMPWNTSMKDATQTEMLGFETRMS